MKHYSFPSPWSAFPVGEEFSLYPEEKKKKKTRLICNFFKHFFFFYELKSGPEAGGVAGQRRRARAHSGVSFWSLGAQDGRGYLVLHVYYSCHTNKLFRLCSEHMPGFTGHPPTTTHTCLFFFTVQNMKKSTWPVKRNGPRPPQETSLPERSSGLMFKGLPENKGGGVRHHFHSFIINY